MKLKRRIVAAPPIIKSQPRRLFITIDPGIGGTGVAVWDYDYFGRLVPPIASTSFGGKVKNGWENSVAEISRQFGIYVRLYMPEKIYFELPALMNSAVGHIASQKGDLVKLAIAAGAIIGAAAFTARTSFEAIPVATWKGQLPKAESTRRILERLPRGYFASYYKPTSHEIDAIGIGLHVKGCL